MGTKAKLSTKVISIFLSALMALSCVYVALPSLAPKAFAATPEEKAWQGLADAFTAAYNGGYMSTKDWESISSSNGTITVSDGTVNGYAYNIVAALGDLLALIGKDKHNSQLRTLIKDTLAADYGCTLGEYQENFLNVLLDVSGIYGTYHPANIWNGNSAEVNTYLPAQTITISATREESAAILSDFESIDALAEADYKIVKSYGITLTAGPETCASTNGSETGAYYVNKTVAAAPGEATEAAAKANLQNIKAYMDYVASDEFKPRYDAWFNGGNAVNTASLYDYSVADINQMRENFMAKYNAVGTGEQAYIEEYIGIANYDSHKAFVDAAYNALSVVGYKDYVAWLVNGTPYPGGAATNRDDYRPTDPVSIEKVITQATTFKNAMTNDSSVINILKGLYPAFDPSKAYNAADESTYYASFDNLIRYLSSLMYNYYLQEIKQAANVLLNNGASTTYSFSNETSKFFNLIKNAVGAANYEEGTNYFKTSDKQINQDKTYYRLDAEYSFTLTEDAEPDAEKLYFTPYSKVEAPVPADIASYYEEAEEPVYALTEDTELKEGKTYYTLADGVYTAVETPDAEALGSYYEITKTYVTYVLTEDTQVNAVKTYYAKGDYKAVTAPSEKYIKTYFEREITSVNYQLTADKVIMNGKTYYTKSGSVYTKVEEPVEEDLGTYYEPKFVAVENPVRSELYDYYEKAGAYYGLKGVGNSEYIEANYESSYSKTSDTAVQAGKTYYTYDEASGKYTKVTNPAAADLGSYYERAECPINDTDLSALYVFFNNAVQMIDAASSYGVNVRNYMDETLEAEIREMKTALYNEQISRGRVTEAFLQAYQPVIDRMSGYIKGGKTLSELYFDIKDTEAKFSSLKSTYNWFSSDPRAAAIQEFLTELYNEVYDRVQAAYMEILTTYNNDGTSNVAAGTNNVNARNYYQLRQNIHRITDAAGTYNGTTQKIEAFVAASYAANKISGSNKYGARNSTNISKWYRNNTVAGAGAPASCNTAYSTVVSRVNAYNPGSAWDATGTAYSHANIERRGKDADLARTTAGKDYFTAWFTANGAPTAGNYASVADTITKLDKFLANSQFTSLLGADELGLGITTLGEYIQYILSTKLFTDEMVNTIVGALFPMLTELFEVTIVKAVKDLDPLDASTFGIDNLYGLLHLYVNGQSDPTGHSSISFEALTNQLGAKIYPSTFGEYLVNNNYATIGNDIRGNTGGSNSKFWDKYRFDENGNQSSANDENGKRKYSVSIKTYLEKHPNVKFDWGINSTSGNTLTATAQNRFNKFCQVLGVVFGAAMPLLRALFGNVDFGGTSQNANGAAVAWANPIGYSLPVIGGVSADIVAYNLKASIRVNHLDLFTTLWIPVMEALGINGDVLSYNFKGVGTFTTGNDATDRTALVTALLDPVWQLILKVSQAPLTSILKLLPNLAYHLMNGSVQNLLNRRVAFHVAGEDCDLKAGADGGVGSSIIAAIGSAFSKAIAGAIKIDKDINLGEMLDLEKTLGFSLKDLNTVLAGIMGMIKPEAVYEVQVGTNEDGTPKMEKRTNLPGIGTGKLACMYSSRSSTYRSQAQYVKDFTDNREVLDSKNGRRTYFTANTQMVLYGLLNWVFRAAQTKGGIADILGFIAGLTGNSLGDSIPQLVYALVEGIESADLAFAALVELLNEPRYDVKKFNWYQPQNHTTDWTATPFTYLQYNNKWTADKAEYIYENVDNIVNSVVNMITPETLEQFNGDVNVWLDRTINSMFNNEGIMNVIEVVTKVGGALAGSPSIAKLLRQQIKTQNANDPEMNLFAWYNVWGYLYDDLHNVELENANQFIAYNVQNNQVYVYEAVPAKEDVETVTLTNVANAAAATAPYSWKIVRAYAAAPTENIKWKISGNAMSEWNHNVYYNESGHDNYNKYKNLFSNLRWTEAGTSESGDILYTWEVKLTSQIISHLKDNGSTLKRIGTAPNYTGYKDENGTYNVGNWYKLTDGGEIEKECSLNARAVFTAVFSELIGPLSNVFSFVLSGTPLRLFQTGNDTSSALTIQGYPAYNNAIVPALEALGVYGLKTQAEYDALANSSGTRAAFDYIVNELFAAMDNLLEDDRVYDDNGNVVSGKGAFQKLIDVMPHLFYFLQSDGLTTVLNNLLMFVWQLLDTLRPIVNLDLDNLVRTLLCRIMKYDYDYEGKLTGTPAKYKANEITEELLKLIGIKAPAHSDAARARDAAAVAKIFLFSVKEMTLPKIFALVEGLIGINATPLTYALEGMIAYAGTTELHYNTNQTKPYAYTSYKVPDTSNTYQTYTINFEGRDTITVTLSALIDILKYEGNAAALDKLAGTLTNLLPGSQNLLTGEGVQGLIQALVTIMDDKPYGSALDRPNWDYIFEGRLVKGSNGVTATWTDIISQNETLGTGTNNSFSRWAELKAVSEQNFDFHNFHLAYMTNLQYLTSWTEEVADATTSVLLSVLDYVVSLLGDGLKDQFAEGTDLSTFSALVDALLAQKVFTPDLMIQLLDLLANVYTYLPDDILLVINHLLTDNAAEGAVVDMLAWRTAGYIVQDYPWKEDGTQDTTKDKVWQANRNYDWFVEGSEAYIHDKTTFMNAVNALLEPAGTLFALIFLGEDYNLLNSMQQNSAHNNDSVVINATNAYATALVPILEALGLDLTNYAPSKYDNGDGTYNGSLFVDDFVTMIDTLFQDIINGPVDPATGNRAGGPVAWLLKNLPTIIYFINADGIKASLDNVFGAVNSVLDAISTVVSLPVDLHNIMDSGLDLTNITFEGVFGMIYTLTKSYDEQGNLLPGLYMSDSLLNYVKTLYVGKLVPFTSINGFQSFKMVYSDAEDESDMVTILIALILEFITDKGTFIDSVDSHGAEVAYNNAEVFDRLLFAGSDMEGVIGQTIAALANPQALEKIDMDWKYFDHDFDLSAVPADHSVPVTPYAFQYLNWTTEWTYTKAETAAEEFDTLIFQALKMLVPSNPADIEEGSLIEKIKDADDLGDILSIDFIFSGDLLQTVLDFVSNLLYGEDSVLNEDLLALIGYVLGGDLTQWNGNKFAFQTVDELPAGAATETVADLAGTVLYYTENGEVEVPAVEDDEGNVVTPATTRTVDRLYYIRQGNQNDFIAGLVKVLAPAKGILAWLLFGESYTFFNPHDTTNEYLITIPGSHGYKDGLALLLEALGCDSHLKYEGAYIGHTLEFISDLANSIAERANAICADPAGEIVALIPELIYFINAGGLQASVTGLLSGPLGLVNQISALGPVLKELLQLPDAVAAASDDESKYAIVEQIVDGLLKGVFAKQGYTVPVNDDGTTDVDFKLTGVNLKYVFNVLEVITGMEITDVIGNKLDLFAIGEIHAYNSKSGDIGAPAIGYKMVFGSNSNQGTNDSFADFITILLSAVVDILEYQDANEDYVNARALGKLVGLKDGKEEIVVAVAKLLKANLNPEILPIDWLYFDGDLSKYESDGNGGLKLKETQPEILPGSMDNYPEPSINYLTYASDWTEDTANYIYNNLGSIINAVLGMIPGLDGATLEQLVSDNVDLSALLFNYKNYSAVTKAVSDLAGQIPEIVNTLLNIALEIDLTSLGSLATLTEDEYEALDAAGKKNAFVSAIISIVTPLRPIVEWFFFNQKLEYFDKDTNTANDPATNPDDIEKLISIGGASAYNDALVPLLEAIGVQCPSYTVNASATAAERNVAFGNFLSILIEKVLMRVDEILADPTAAVTDVLPNLIYWLNTNALATVLNNLLAPFVALINEALPAVIALTDGTDLDDTMQALKDALTENNITAETTLKLTDVIKLVVALLPADDEGEESDPSLLNFILDNVNVTKLDLVEILRLVEKVLASGLIKVEDKTIQANLKLVDVVGAEKIENFYLNDIEYFASANGKPAFRMPGSADMVTILINYLLEVLLYKTDDFSNAEELDKILDNGKDDPDALVQKIVNLIYGIKEIQEPDPVDLNWNYFNGEQTLGDGITVPLRSFVYLNYNNQWTFEKAVYIDNGLEDVVKEILKLAGVADGDISALIDEKLPLGDYLNADTLNTIVGAINSLFNGTINLPDVLLNLIGLVLNIDLASWDGTYDFVAEAPAGAEIVSDDEHDLNCYISDGIVHYIIDTTENFNDFASGLQLILEPAQGLLGWLLLGDTYGFFVKNVNGNVDPVTNERLNDELIRVPGSKGYDTGLVLLLEALGCKNLKAYTEYEDISVLVKDVIVSVLNRVTEIMDNPIEEILALIPEVIYFINANGLGAVVQNVASVLLAIVNEVLKSNLFDVGALGDDIMAFLTENTDGTYKVDLDALMTGILKDLLGDKAPADFTFSFSSVDLQFVIDMVEIFTGLEIDDVVGYTLEKFIIGVVEKYDSASVTFTDTYRVIFADALDGEGHADTTKIGQTRADMITILLSLALDLLDSSANVDAIVALVNGMIEDPEKQISAEMINSIVALLKGGQLEAMMDIDWFYFDPDYSLYDENGVKKDPAPTVDYTTTIDTPARTINYIEYYTDWTEETADYLAANINQILAEVFDLIPGMAGKTVAGLIEENFTLSDLYNKDVFVKVIETIQGLMDQYGEVLVNTLALIIGGDLTKIAEIDTETLDVSDKESFAATLTTVLEPVYTLLNWVLFGEDMKYFYDNEFYRNGGGDVEPDLYDDARDLINLTGAEGYKYGLVPLLEALGVELPDARNVDKLVATENVEDSFLYKVIIAVLNRAEEILANPVDELVALLPNILYFINAGGLSASVFNLINAVYGLLPQVSDLLDTLGVDLVVNGTDFSSLDVNVIVNSLLADILPDGVTLDVTHLDLMAVVNVIEAATGLEITDVVTKHNIRYFYFGKLESFPSTNGKTAFRMVYSEKEDKGAMLTLLINFVAEVLLYKNETTNVDNVAALEDLLGIEEADRETVDTIIRLITGDEDIYTYTYGQMKWNYFDETVTIKTEDPETGVVTVNTALQVPTDQFIYLEYANDWTLARADGIDKNLAALIDSILPLVMEDASSLSDLLNGYYEEFAKESIFTAENLNTVLGFVQGFLYGEDSVIGQHLAELAGLVLGGDITGWSGTYTFVDYSDSASYLTDNTGLRYTAENGIKEYAVETAEDFANGLYLILKPASHLLAWLLLDEGYNFFAVDQDASQTLTLINIPGSDGYGKALALLLEALGLDLTKTAADYNGDGAALLKDVINLLVDRIEEIIADPVNEVLDLIPELIYFINAGGLSVLVNNLVGPLLNVVNAVVAKFDLSQLNVDILDAMMIDGKFDPIKYVEAYVTDLLNKYTYEPVTFTLDGVNTGWAVELIEALTDVRIMDVIGTSYPISKFVLGTPTLYDTKASFDVAYKIAFPETDKYNYRCDLITIVLSLAIELLENAHNQVIIEDEFGLTAGTIGDVLALVKERAIHITPDYEWFYFDENASLNGTDITLTTPERTINYLTYMSDWDEDFADYVDDHLNSIIASVLQMLGQGDSTVADIVAGVFKMSDVYTAENLNAIVSAIKGLAEQLNGLVTSAVGDEANNDVIAEALDLFFDIDLHAWDNMTFEDALVSDKEGFSEALAEIVAPLHDILNWLFFGSSIRLFNRKHTDTGVVEDILVINGYDGYNEGLVPLLEALGVDLTDAQNTADIPEKVEKIVLAALTRAEEILADPVDQVLALLPEILYFINANGLAASVNHLLGAPLSLVDGINALLADLGVTLNIGDTEYDKIDINGLLNSLLNNALAEQLNGKTLEIDTQKLDLVALVTLVEQFTGLELIDVVTENKLDNFYLGQIESYTSANGKTLFKMAYSDEAQKDRADMITVLVNFAVEAVLYGENAAVIENLAGIPEGTVKAFLEALKTLSGTDYEYDWNYFGGTYEEAFDRYKTPDTQFNNYLTYKSDWTKSLANNLYTNLDDIVNAILAMTHNESSSLGEIINKSFTLYKGEYLNKVLDLVKKLYDVLDDTLLGAIDSLLDIDLTYWKSLSFDADASYTSTEFAAAVVEMVKPIYRVIDWLFFGKDITLFVDNEHGGPENGGENLIVIQSIDAYTTGLAPILEALGVELPAYDGTQSCGTKVTFNGVEMDFFAAIVNAILGRVDAILADPIDEALALLPELLYFINANGLSTAVYNMLGGVMDAVDKLIELGYLDIGSATIKDYVADNFNIDLDKLDLVGLFSLVESLEAVHGLKLNAVFTGDYDEDGVEENYLEKFHIGDYAEAYTSTAENYKGYKLSLNDENKGDLLTMLLSVVLEVLLYDDNEQPITDILSGFLPDFTTAKFHSLKLLLTAGIQTNPQMLNINWVYFWNYSEEELQAKIEEVLSAESNALPAEPLGRTVNALKYGGNEGVQNLWNKDLRDYLNANLESIVDLAVAMATANSDTPSASLSDLLQNNLDIWTDDTANAILNYVKNALTKIDDVLVDTVGSLLGAGQLSTLKNVTARGIDCKEDFVDFFVETLSPLSTVLDFVLFGGSYEFFTHLSDGEPYTITLKGGEGYKYGLAPILAALGVDTDISEESTAVALREVLTNLTNRIDEVLYGGDTINEALKLILNVIYFIDADGLSISVMNLLAPIDELLKEVNDVLLIKKNDDGTPAAFTVNSLITAVDLENLNFDFIFNLVLDKTGINVNDPIGSYLKEFYFGATEYFTSYGDLGNFRMVYTEEENRVDMVTILVTLLLDVVIYEGNHDALVGLVKKLINTDDDAKAEEYVNTIVALLLNKDYRVPMLPYNWAYNNYADTGTVISAANGLTGDSIFGTGLYGPLYTREMGAYISKFLPLFIDTYLVLLGVKNQNGDIYRSLEDILKQLIGTNIYTNAILQKIGSAITGAVAGIKENLGEEMFNHIVEVLNASLGVDLNDILYGRIATIQEGNQAQFIQAICDLLAPAAPILRWLLTDTDIALFNHDAVINASDKYEAGDDYIVLRGAEGYQNAIIPILEALRVGDSAGIKTQEEYNQLGDADLIKYILNPIFDRLNTILQDPLVEIFKELPAVVYFLNSNGLDTAFKNLLNAVYSLLNAIEPITGEIDLYELIGLDLENVNIDSLIEQLINSINSDAQFKLTDMVGEALVELTLGTVDKFTSVRKQPEYLKGSYANGQANYDGSGNAIDYTMHYSADNAGGDKIDYVTIIMRLLLKFISIPQNVTAIEAMLKGKLNDTGYKFLCSLLENFSQMAASEGGMDKIMYTVYYIFYAALNAGVATNNGLARFNGDYSFLNQLFATSNVGFLRQLEISLGDLLNKYTPDVVNDHEVIPNGQISFWEKIIQFFKKIGDFFRRLFGG